MTTGTPPKMMVPARAMLVKRVEGREGDERREVRMVKRRAKSKRKAIISDRPVRREAGV